MTTRAVEAAGPADRAARVPQSFGKPGGFPTAPTAPAAMGYSCCLPNRGRSEPHFSSDVGRDRRARRPRSCVGRDRRARCPCSYVGRDRRARCTCSCVGRDRRSVLSLVLCGARPPERAVLGLVWGATAGACCPWSCVGRACHARSSLVSEGARHLARRANPPETKANTPAQRDGMSRSVSFARRD